VYRVSASGGASPLGRSPRLTKSTGERARAAISPRRAGRRPRIAPELVDHAVGRDDFAGVEEQQGEQRSSAPRPATAG